jgi:hypothetical protein
MMFRKGRLRRKKLELHHTNHELAGQETGVLKVRI